MNQPKKPRISPDARTYASHAAIAIDRATRAISEEDLAAAFHAGTLHERQRARSLVHLADRGTKS